MITEHQEQTVADLIEAADDVKDTALGMIGLIRRSSTDKRMPTLEELGKMQDAIDKINDCVAGCLSSILVLEDEHARLDQVYQWFPEFEQELSQANK